MRKHSILNVLVLAMLLAVSGALTINAGECVQMTAAECAALGCAPGAGCPPMTAEECAAQGCDPSLCASISSASTTKATATLASAKTVSLTSASKGACVPMTAEECAALGCDPSQCEPMTSCGTASSCGTGNVAMTLVGVHDAQTGIIMYRIMPVSVVKNLMASAKAKQVDAVQGSIAGL